MARRGDERGDETTTLVLAVLASEGPSHGYGIVRAIARRSASALKPGEGVLYPALMALERDGLIAGAWDQPTPGRPPRKVYTLTDDGRAALERRVRSWRSRVSAIDAVLGGIPDAEPT